MPIKDETRTRPHALRRGLLTATLLSGLPLGWTAAAQDAEPTVIDDQPVPEDEDGDVIVVQGYRAALQDSTNAKRDANGFTDTIFADDIGKLPSQNLAESLNRIPGVKINRDVTGEGQQISVRGLGPSFTKIVLNGNNIFTASDGNLTGTNSNREVDLDVFPAELFSSLVVNKTPMADQLEGGTSGYVNLRTSRPFDAEGQRFRFSVEGAYTTINEEVSPIVSAIYSNTWNDKFGILAGVVASRRESRVDGYETVGFSDGCVADFTDPPANTTSNCLDGYIGRNHFRYSPYATADYVAAHPELSLAVGDRIDPVATSGLTQDELDRGILPYLGRGMYTIGDRDATSALGSVQFRPSEAIDIAIDVLYAETKRDFDRVEAMNWGRRNFLSLGAAWIPEDLTIDGDQVIRSGTLYNTRAWVGHRAYEEDFEFFTVMPSLSWDVSEVFRMDLSASYSESDFRRDEPYFNFLTPGMTVDFANSGDVATFDYSLDISQPNVGWVWNDVQGDQLRFNRNFRDVDTLGFHADFDLGAEPERTGVQFGIHYDEATRDLEFFGGGNNDVLKNEYFFPSDAYANIEDYLLPSPISDLGDVFDEDIGYSGIAYLDIDRFYEAIRYDEFEPTAAATGDQFGQGVGGIEEKYLGLYLMANVEADLLDQPLRINAGVRWVDTDQTLTSLADEGETETQASYAKFLPSFSAVYDVTDALKLRASASRTMTRANPGEMYPNSVWTSSGIDTARAGNPNLSPFESVNFDVGGEYYFGELGYVGLYYFDKEVRGFTRDDTVDVLFANIADYGLDPNDLSETQAEALVACGGPQSCNVQVSTRTNVQGTATLKGFEGIWVQPLDFLLEGLGFNASATKIEQDADDPAAIITGISDWTYNATGYYENELFQFRLTYYHQDGAVASGFQGYDGSDGLPARRIRSDHRTQVDFSAIVNLPFLENQNVALTFDGYNITNEPVRNLFEYDDLSYDVFYPGATYTVGLRGSF
ncbi:TonB-dependent receptor [Parvularcula dongshanensis]|uniref:TonB-dependent receptor n=1 Tax=Parvularcula dongshanensis TaxID=1173995 RepID=A0A840I5H1_9PROT|nr:TonB-dependent receptor [Parvularcula dongshanensis]MBB4659444.1 TonB-dependent receptor [Parvularcula dongshanensis]